MAKKSPYIKVTRKEYIENRRLLDYNDSELYYTFENIKINNLEEFLEYCKTKIYPQLLLAKEEHISDIKDDFEDFEDDDSTISKFYQDIINNKKVEHDIELNSGRSIFYLWETLSEYKERRTREIKDELKKKNRPKKSKKNIEGYISKLTPEELEKFRELIK